MPTTIQFNAQGTFSSHKPKQPKTFHDVTNSASTSWNPMPISANFAGAIAYLGNGEFVGVTAGCTCFSVVDGGLVSQSVLVGVDQDPATCPAACP